MLTSHRLIITFIVFVFAQFFFAAAFYNSAAQALCEVEVSFIKGSAESAQVEQIDSVILEQLKELPFSSFVLLNKERKKVDFNEVSFFSLTTDHGENKVAITPIKIEGNKVPALIEWTSAKGENILSSKISLINGGNMVFGAEHGNTRCTVINISINCQ